MFTTAAMITLATLGAAAPASPGPSVAPLPPLQIAGAPVAMAPGGGSLVLHSPLLAVAGGTRRPVARLAQAPTPSGGADSPTQGESGEEAPVSTISEDEARELAREEAETALLRRRAALTRVHRTLGITTFGALTVTTALGTLSAINQATAFGPGECRAGGHPIGGFEFGCSTLTSLHQLSAFISVGLYATTGVFALAMPDPERASEGSDARATRLRLHRAVAWVHLAGMVLQPILGIISVNPTVVGANGADATFVETMRTIHLSVGYVTWAALGTGMVLELLK
jgi:hypothetical protein